MFDNQPLLKGLRDVQKRNNEMGGTWKMCQVCKSSAANLELRIKWHSLV